MKLIPLAIDKVVEQGAPINMSERIPDRREEATLGTAVAKLCTVAEQASPVNVLYTNPDRKARSIPSIPMLKSQTAVLLETLKEAEAVEDRLVTTPNLEQHLEQAQGRLYALQSRIDTFHSRSSMFSILETVAKAHERAIEAETAAKPGSVLWNSTMEQYAWKQHMEQLGRWMESANNVFDKKEVLGNTTLEEAKRELQTAEAEVKRLVKEREQVVAVEELRIAMDKAKRVFE